MKILLLATNHKSFAARVIAKELQKAKIQYDILNPNQLFMMISNAEHGRNRLFDDHTGQVIKKVDLKSYDVIIPRIGKDVDYSCEVLKYLEEVFDMRTIQSSAAISNAFSKIRSAIYLRSEGIRTPRTFYINKIKNADLVLRKLSKENKYVIKLDKGSKGKQVTIVSGVAEAKTVLDTLGSMNNPLIIQEFIESNGTDIRAIVVDGKVIAAYERKAAKNELRTNISTGGEGKKVTLSEEEKKFCVSCSYAVGLEVAGIDFMRTKDGKLYCIEVNHCPGMNIQKFTPVSICGEIVKFAVKKAEEPFSANIRNSEILKLKSVFNETYNSKEFRNLYSYLQGKVVESRKTGKQTVISDKSVLQQLLMNQLTWN